MADLSHWDFGEHFSGYEAAALILGLEPRESEDEQWRVRVVSERMALHYKQALHNAHEHFFGDPSLETQTGQTKLIELSSVKLRDLCRRAHVFNDETTLSDWIGGLREHKFELQEFSREAIAGWLVAIGMTSVYLFDRTTVAPGRHGDRWPWGNHHTVLLGHLEAAARRFWVGYDPAESTTANTNATVIEWLQTERKVSGKMAEAIATMLRPDGLATGPRK